MLFVRTTHSTSYYSFYHNMDLSVYITSDLTASERRISPQWLVEYLLQRLEQITGIEAAYQTLHYYPIKTSNEYSTIHEAGLKDERDVSELGVAGYSRIHVIDTDPNSTLAALEDDSAGFQLSEEDYAKKSNTVLQWKKQNQLGRFDPNFDDQQRLLQEENEKIAEDIKVGNRCRVINIASERRGVVRFVGKIQELDEGENYWVGIEFDEPVGKNDGLIGQLRVFEARKNHGSFVKPKQVEVGDFPELDPFGSDEEEI